MCHGTWIKQQVQHVADFFLNFTSFYCVFHSVLEDIIRVSTKELRIIRKYIFMMV